MTESTAYYEDLVKLASVYAQEIDVLKGEIKFLEECILASGKDVEYYKGLGQEIDVLQGEVMLWQEEATHYKQKLEKGIRVYANNNDADGYFLLDHPYSTNATLVLDEGE